MSTADPPTTANLWHYRCAVLRVIDGDSIIVECDKGFANYQHMNLRLLGINAPEMVGANRTEGLAAKSFVEAWVLTHSISRWPFIIRTVKTDSFGRYLADLWTIDSGLSLSQTMLDAGVAAPYS